MNEILTTCVCGHSKKAHDKFGCGICPCEIDHSAGLSQAETLPAPDPEEKTAETIRDINEAKAIVKLAGAVGFLVAIMSRIERMDLNAYQTGNFVKGALDQVYGIAGVGDLIQTYRDAYEKMEKLEYQEETGRR